MFGALSLQLIIRRYYAEFRLLNNFAFCFLKRIVVWFSIRYYIVYIIICN